jgi:glutaredoxin 3
MSNNIIIYSTKTCPYCTRAKQLLDAKGASYTELFIDEQPELFAEMQALCDNRRTVPQIIINDQAIGGFDDLAKLEHQGMLDTLLQQENNDER